MTDLFPAATTVREAVMTRRSIRNFTDMPVSLSVLREVLDAARFAPSGCNFQPWEATVLTGEPLRALQAKMQGAAPQDPPEYRWDSPNDSPRHLARVHELGGQVYGALEIERADTAARGDFSALNIVSFGAPALLLVYFPRLMLEPQWSDVGMWMQTVMLLLREKGLDSCPQEYLWMHARLIKEFLGISDKDYIFFCGLAIGYRDAEDPVNQFQRTRVPLDEQVKFLGF